MAEELLFIKKIVLVFNNKKEVAFISEKLKEIGIAVHVCYTINEGMKQIKEHEPELVIINIGYDDSEFTNWETKYVIKPEMRLQQIIVSKKLSENYIRSSESDDNPSLDAENKWRISKCVSSKLLLCVIRSMINNQPINWFMV